MAKEFKNYIDGQWIDSFDGKTFEQRNPANLDEVTGIWPSSSKHNAQKAIAAAQAAFPKWSKLSAHQRAEYFKTVLDGMKKRKTEFAEVLTKENGKTLKESEAEINSAIKEMEFQINEGIRLSGETVSTSIDGIFAYSTRQPLGVVSIISPWNFPFNVPGRKLTPALMAGNTCVFKPASLTPQTGQKFVELFIEADFPNGVINFITGSGATVGEEMITNPAIKAISFTGSTDVGRRINQKAAQIMARTQLEMGGKNPIIVLEDANLEEAVKATVIAAYACAGQWCTSTSRAIVAEKIISEFTERVVNKAKQIVVGNGLDETTTMGPVCGSSQLESILKYIEIGKQEGAKLLLGGNRITGEKYDKGCFIEPTVFTDVKGDMKIAQEEIFGPVLSIMEVADLEEAIETANKVDFGLSSSIYTSNLQKAFTFLEQTEVGLAHVNLMTALKEPQLTFGGIKASGFGIPEAGKTGVEFFTEHKVVYVKYR
ncbi:MAG: aldehyde dehydrogenase family protein [Planctomycetota bacterium]|jgi:aldehyde dehydrogenase (NAD+)